MTPAPESPAPAPAEGTTADVHCQRCGCAMRYVGGMARCVMPDCIAAKATPTAPAGPPTEKCGYCDEVVCICIGWDGTNYPIVRAPSETPTLDALIAEFREATTAWTHLSGDWPMSETSQHPVAIRWRAAELALRAALSEARKDSERLDWMQENAADVAAVFVMEPCSNVGWRVATDGSGPGGSIREEGATLREAIDAARHRSTENA